MPMDGETIERQESFGMLSFSRGQYNKGQHLFGSSISHSNVISLKISTASERRHLNQHWYHAEDMFIEVEMSPTQFTDAITNMNTSGVPVTIRYMNDERIPPPKIENVYNKFSREFSEDVKEIMALVSELAHDVEDALLAPGTLRKQERVEIAEKVAKLNREVTSNIPFVQKQFSRQAAKTVNEAKSEIEAFQSNTILSLGKKKLRKLLGKDISVKLLGEE